MCKILEDMCMEARREGWIEGWREGWLEGWREGQAEKRQEFILRMLNAGRYTLNEIAELFELPLEQIKQFKAGQGL